MKHKPAEHPKKKRGRPPKQEAGEIHEKHPKKDVVVQKQYEDMSMESLVDRFTKKP